MLITIGMYGLVAALLPILWRRMRTKVFLVAAAVSAAAFAGIVAQAPTVLAGGEIRESLPWIPQIGLDIDLRTDALSWLLALVVTGVGALVLLYCGRYFGPREHDVGRFSAVLLAFAGVMYGLVVADNVYLMFVFWEATSVFSYLLIGHYTGKRVSRGSALQALLVTTLGGLVMLVGVVMLHATSGTALLSEMVAAPPPFTPFTITAVLLVLVGAASKSALVPFHFWLPGAMAAPTPVSAYLHAASMVKAGVYLIARLAPGFAEMPGWREALVTLGVWTMLLGGYRSLRQYDLKLILAYGTVSQLGFLTVVTGFGTRDAALAGLTLLLAHACFKAALFLTVGMIDHRTGTRDIRKLCGLGRSAPVLASVAVVAAGSMAGLPPMLGFVAKEAVFTAFLDAGRAGLGWGWVALAGVALGSTLTAAYTLRFLWGAFSRKPGVEPVRYAPEHLDFMLAPLLLAIASVVLGLASPLLDPVLALYADTVHGPVPGHAHLALWHGLEPALAVSAVTLGLGVLLFLLRDGVARVQAGVPPLVDAARGYWASIRFVDRAAARITGLTQRGSLPFYLSTILLVFIGSTAASLVGAPLPPTPGLQFSLRPTDLAIVVAMTVAAIAATRSRRRFQGLVLVGVTGYGMAAIFALNGAPDLALTQALIETITLVAFVLVLRKLPPDHSTRSRRLPGWIRWSIGLGFGLSAAAILLLAMGSRTAETDSLAFPALAKEGGHGANIVNVALVDIRGWDTMGELSVLVAAATGVASLIFLTKRNAKRSTAPVHRPRALTSAPITEPVKIVGDDSMASEHRKMWLLAGTTLAPENRSIVLEVVVRLVFHAMIVASLYLLFVGHNEPGGGFAGGTVAGLALVARYLAGGRKELDEAVRIDAGKLLGIGMGCAAGAALVPMLFGQPPLTTSWIDVELPWIGHLVFVTSTIFDIGVYLIVVALTIDVLRSLGAQLDIAAERGEEDPALDAREVTARLHEADPEAVPAASWEALDGGGGAR
ncbi:MAG: Na+/H+ antiporter subunit A [Pseudoclavibacter sp.]|nr:Na+/H+ antiporter subunit A [Pseudoclavibacter sp.]